MGQKTNPIGNRLGFIRGWDSAWYGGKDFGDRILEDYEIRKYLHARLKKASVSKIVIEIVFSCLSEQDHMMQNSVIVFLNGRNRKIQIL